MFGHGPTILCSGREFLIQLGHFYCLGVLMAIKQEVPCFIQVFRVSSVICISCSQGKQNNTAGCVMALKVNYIAQRRASQHMLNLE